MDCEDYLRISAIQHYSFCKRQWALIDIELYWAENAHTIHGKLMRTPVEQENSGGFANKKSNKMKVSKTILRYIYNALCLVC